MLAAQYESCRRVPDPGGGDAAIEVRLRPGSAFLWADEGGLTALGFDLTGPAGTLTRRTLATQRETLDLPDPAGDDQDPIEEENPAAPDAPEEPAA